MRVYNIDENVIHLTHGVGIVKSIEEREFNEGIKQKFYVLEIMDQGWPKKVFVPFDSADKRLRPIMKQDDINAVYKILREKSDVTLEHQTWNRRYRDYMEKIHTGKAIEIAKVLRALWDLALDKDLSFGERLLHEQAKNKLIKELALAENVTDQDIETKLFGIMS